MAAKKTNPAKPHRDMEDNTYWFVFIGNSILLAKSADGTLSVPLSTSAPTPLHPWTHVQELPTLGGTPCRAYRIETVDGINGLAPVGLRESYYHLPRPFYDMAGKAYELLYWDTCTRFCGCCGGGMAWSTVISKRCNECGKEVWPQVSPAIIVRITRHDRVPEGEILLVHARNFRRNEMYGLVAGFVETGESAEDCVRREVAEEVHLQVRDIKYFGSQSWPYPCGIMLGFTAEYDGGDLQLQHEELSRGGWFAKDKLPPIPDKMSIARRLIDDWIEN